MSFKAPKGIPLSHANKLADVQESKTVSSTSDNGSDIQSQNSVLNQTSNQIPDHPISEVPYNEPKWSGKPLSNSYLLSVIKNGVQINTIKLIKPYYTFGRLLTCDVHLEHPSISRYHAIIQHRPDSATDIPESTLFSTNPCDAGFYIYDLGSTHGTFLNKNKLQPCCYYRIRIGQTIKFGGSSRIFVLDQSSDSVQEIVEAEAEAEIKEIKEKEAEYKRLLANTEAERIKREQHKESLGVTWVTDDEMLPPDDRGTEKMELDLVKESYYIDDPKKALKNFFDREGLELDYETEESGSGHTKTYTVRVRLPIETLSGESAYAEGSHTGKKKEAVVLCALEACRLLDAEGILRESMTSYKRKKRNWEENDYYDSDEDNFLDRTGDVDKKRKSRMRRVGKIANSSDTYESLKLKLTEVETELSQLHKTLANSNKIIDTSGPTVDSLDSFMKSIKGQVDKQKQSEMKLRIHQLRKEEEKLKKLIKIAEPYKLPSINLSVSQKEDIEKEDNVPVSKDNVQEEDSKDNIPKDINKDILQQDTCSSNVKSLNSNVLSSTSESLSDSSNCDVPQQKKRRFIGPSLPNKLTDTKQEKWSEENTEDYASWLPPEDQSGDGITKLNKKYGY